MPYCQQYSKRKAPPLPLVLSTAHATVAAGAAVVFLL
jgi:hypothetical protein